MPDNTTICGPTQLRDHVRQRDGADLRKLATGLEMVRHMPRAVV